ncbi:putative mucin-associated surface protein (MASP), partial [Trypanosoma cruzi]
LSCRPRLVRYAWPYRSFPPSCHPPLTFGWTILRCKERRIKAAQNHTPWRGSCDGYMGFWTLAEYRHSLPTCGLQKTAQTAYHAVVCLRLRELAKGWNLRRAAAVSCGWRTAKSATSQVIIF